MGNDDLRKSIIGASSRSIILEIDGRKVFCHNSLFHKILNDPSIHWEVAKRPAHTDYRRGIEYPESYWVRAYVPTFFGL